MAAKPPLVMFTSSGPIETGQLRHDLGNDARSPEARSSCRRTSPCPGFQAALERLDVARHRELVRVAHRELARIGILLELAYAPVKKRMNGAMVSRSASARRTAVTAIAAWYYPRCERHSQSIVRLALWSGRRASAIVCIHGIESHGLRYFALAERLGPDVRVVAPDLRGHGRSIKVGPWTLERHVDDLLPLLTADIDRPVLLGHSYGGLLAWELARAAPQSIAALIRPTRPLACLPNSLERACPTNTHQLAIRGPITQPRLTNLRRVGRRAARGQLRSMRQWPLNATPTACFTPSWHGRRRGRLASNARAASLIIVARPDPTDRGRPRAGRIHVSRSRRSRCETSWGRSSNTWSSTSATPSRPTTRTTSLLP